MGLCRFEKSSRREINHVRVDLERSLLNGDHYLLLIRIPTLRKSGNFLQSSVPPTWSPFESDYLKIRSRRTFDPLTEPPGAPRNPFSDATISGICQKLLQALDSKENADKFEPEKQMGYGLTFVEISWNSLRRISWILDTQGLRSNQTSCFVKFQQIWCELLGSLRFDGPHLTFGRLKGKKWKMWLQTTFNKKLAEKILLNFGRALTLHFSFSRNFVGEDFTDLCFQNSPIRLRRLRNHVNFDIHLKINILSREFLRFRTSGNQIGRECNEGRRESAQTVRVQVQGGEEGDYAGAEEAAIRIPGLTVLESWENRECVGQCFFWVIRSKKTIFSFFWVFFRREAPIFWGF